MQRYCNEMFEWKYEIFNIAALLFMNHVNDNQLEKLEAAKAAWLVYLSLLSITGSFLALLGLT